MITLPPEHLHHGLSLTERMVNLPVIAGFSEALGFTTTQGEPDIDARLVTSQEQFAALESEWDALWRRQAAPRFSQSFAWARIGWETTGRPRGRRLCILVLRREGRIVLIWPMTLRRRLIWTIAAPLGGEFTEYDPMLVEAGPEAAGHVGAAWQALRRLSGADVVTVPWVNRACVVGTRVSSAGLRHHSETLPSPVARFDGFADWDAYWKTRSKNTKGNVGRKARRFAELGHVTFELIEDRGEFNELLRWTLTHKVAWMKQVGLDNDFMRTAEFHDFLQRLAATRSPCGRLVMLALKLDGRVVATQLGGLDDTMFEQFIAAQDPAHAASSVGSIILMECLKWCLESRRSYDFRIGAEPYKLDWATEDHPKTTFHLASTLCGDAYLSLSRLAQAARRRKDRLRERLPASFRQRVKGLLRVRWSGIAVWAAATASCLDIII